MSFKIIITNSYWNSQQVPLNACGLLMTGIVGGSFHDLFALIFIFLMKPFAVQFTAASF